jgi:hypothetical protein
MVVGMSGLVASFTGESSLPAPLQDHLQQQRGVEPTTMDWMLIIVGIPNVVAGMASFIGMLRFAPWARPLAVGTSAMALVGLAFFGPTVEPGIATALYHLSSMSFGAVVAVAYFSPTVSTWFEDALPKRAPSANE